MPTAVASKTIKIANNRCIRFSPASLLVRWAPPVVIIVSYLVLAVQPDLRHAIPLLTAVTAVLTVWLCICLVAGERGRWRCTPVQVMVVAVLIRVLFVWRPAELSDDIFRYLWDGLRLLAGHNPYTFAPDAVPSTRPMPAGLLALVNHSHLTTIYPPAAQLVFAVGASLKTGITGIKLLLVGFDLVTCALLMRLLQRIDKPPWTAIIYAWHPLPVLEIAGSGHIDGAVMLFLLLAVCLLADVPDAHRRGIRPCLRACRPFLSGVAFTFAVLTKLFPLVFLPGMLLVAGRSRRKVFCIGAATAMLALVLPFCPDIRHAWGTLTLYARTWEFSGCLYRLLSSTPLAGDGSRWLLGMAYLGVAITAYRPIVSQRPSIPDLYRAFYILCLGFLLLTPTLHPWYALYLVLFLPFSADPGGLVLSWAVLLAYRILIPYTMLGAWVEDDLTPLLIFAAPVVAWLASFGLRACRTIDN